LVDGGIRDTFDVVPGAKVSVGPKQRATAKFIAHNGKTRTFRPVVGNDCGKKKASGKAKRHARSSRPVRFSSPR
jgi:hypothetical protein